MHQEKKPVLHVSYAAATSNPDGWAGPGRPTGTKEENPAREKIVLFDTIFVSLITRNYYPHLARLPPCTGSREESSWLCH